MQKRNYTSNNKSNFRINVFSQNKTKIKYYVKCPHCNYPLNEDIEVKKYYNSLNYHFS